MMIVTRLRQLLSDRPAAAHVVATVSHADCYSAGDRLEIESVTVDRHGVVNIVLGKSAGESAGGPPK